MVCRFVTNYDDKTDTNALSYRGVLLIASCDTDTCYTSIDEYGYSISFLNKTEILIDGLLDGHVIDVIMDFTFIRLYDCVASWKRIICSNGGTEIENGLSINERGNILTIVHHYRNTTITYNGKSATYTYVPGELDAGDIKVRNVLFATVKPARH